MNGAIVGAGAVTLYGISSIVWKLVGTFSTLTPVATGYYGKIQISKISKISLSDE